MADPIGVAQALRLAIFGRRNAVFVLFVFFVVKQIPHRRPPHILISATHLAQFAIWTCEHYCGITAGGSLTSEYKAASYQLEWPSPNSVLPAPCSPLPTAHLRAQIHPILRDAVCV
jgi:hypothetical protein